MIGIRAGRRLSGLCGLAAALAVAGVALAAGSSPAAAAKKEPVMNRSAALAAPEDRALSPYTGYTRAHWLEITEKLIAGVLPYFSPETGMPELKGVPWETGHFKKLFDVGGRREAFDRTLTLVATYTAATGRDRVPGYSGSIVEPYLKEIIRGTDPADPHYWGPHPRYDVFGTNVASAVLLSPRFFWDPLTDTQKRNLLAYFKDLSRTFAYDCNHWYFHMITVPVLERNGVESNREFLSTMFERLLDWYRGDGWFTDGGNRGFDNYNLWGFQLYNQQLMHFDRPWREKFGGRVNQTTARFLESFPYLYGRDGGPIPYGRSTTYRFASLAAIGWASLNGTSTLPPGEARRIASGCLRYFWEHGCLSENGLLEPGWWGPNSVVAEPYMDHGSPYWAAQGLICLAIPENDPFWTETEKPMPADAAGGRVVLPGAQMLLRVSPVDGEARLYPVGQPFTHWGAWQRGIKYCQYAYSSFLGWCALGEGGPDLGAGRSGFSPDGKAWRFRERPRPVEITADRLVSSEVMEFPEMPGVDKEYDDYGEITTWTLVGNSGEVHIFWHNSPRPVYLYLGGYGISVPEGGSLSQDRGDNRLTIQGGENRSIMKVLQAPEGSLSAELLEPRPGWRYSHNFDGRGAFPHWQSAAPVSSNTPVAIYVDGVRGRPIIDPEISLHLDRGLLSVRFEGRTHLVRLPY
jgi:hypothetical protein